MERSRSCGSRPQAAAPGDRAARRRTFVQHNTVSPKASLGRCPLSVELQAKADDGPALEPVEPRPPEELQAACRNPGRCSRKAWAVSPPMAQAHALHPVTMERPSATSRLPCGSPVFAGKAKSSGRHQQAAPKILSGRRRSGARFDSRKTRCPFFSQGKSSASFSMWQSCQAEAGIGDPDALCVVGEHLRRNLHQRAHARVNHLACPLAAMEYDQSVDVRSVVIALQ